MNNETKHFIKFLKEQNMLIPIMLMMKDNGVTFENLHKKAEECAITGSGGEHPTVAYYMDIVENQICPCTLNTNGISLDYLWINYVLDLHTSRIKDLYVIADPTPSIPNRKELQQKFIDFLKAEGLLIQYCVELAMKPSSSSYDYAGYTLSEICNKASFNNWIEHSFYWAQNNNSLKEVKMWEDASNKWTEICNSQ